MTTQTEALKLALEALAVAKNMAAFHDDPELEYGFQCAANELENAFKEALVQPEQEQYSKEELAEAKAWAEETAKVLNNPKNLLSNEQVEPTEVRLWDSQWINVVNHDNCYQGWDKEDAINHAVKMTEKYIASNFAENTHPPVPTTQPEQESVAMADYMEIVEKYAALKASQPEKNPAALKLHRGEICYKSQEDDQSFGMWCPVTQNFLPFAEGTLFYTTPPQLKEPEQEPVAWITKTGSVWKTKWDDSDIPLYTTPPQRTWVGLTDVERIELMESTHPKNRWTILELCEAKLRKLNEPQQRNPQFKEFIKWVEDQGHDAAHTYNPNTGKWICLNPMTADLWKAWEAAHGITASEAEDFQQRSKT